MLHRKDILLSIWKANRSLVVLCLGLSFISGIITISIPIAIGKYYDFLFGYNSFKAQLLDFLPIDLDDIRIFLWFFFGLVVINIFILYGQKYTVGLLGEKVVYQVRNSLFKHQLSIPLRDYEDKGVGRYLLRFSGDLSSIKNFITKGMVLFFSDIILLLLSIVVLYSIDYRLGMIMMIGLLIPLGIILLLNRWLSQRTRTHRRSKSLLLSFTNTRLRGINTIQFFNKDVPERKKFKKLADKSLSAGIQYQKVVGLINAIIPGSLYLLVAGLFAFLYYGNYLNQPSTGSGILVFIIILLTILPVIRRLLRVNIVWELGNISFEKLLNVYNRASNINELSPKFVYNTGEVEIDHLSYEYKAGQKIFETLCLSFPSKSISVLTGNPGTGKSTLMKLITGLYKPNSGTIMIDGQDISNVNLKSLRRHIAIISDDVPLMGSTVFESISYSRKAIKRGLAQEVLEYLQKGNQSLDPLRLDDSIGDLGAQLSKGQRKLLAYARALLTGKEILIIDEPFDGFSGDSYQFWADELQHLATDKTVIVFSVKELSNLIRTPYRFNMFKDVEQVSVAVES